MHTLFHTAPHAPLLFLHPPVCVPPVRAKQRGGGTLPPGLGACPGSLAPFAHTQGTGHCFRACAASHSCATPALKPGGGRGTTSQFICIPSCVSPCMQIRGRVVLPPGLPLTCPLGTQTGKALLPFHTPPVHMPPLCRNPGGGAWVCMWPPVCMALLHATGGTLVPIPTWPLICVSPLHANWGRRGACHATSGIGCGPCVSPLCARGGRRGKGGGLPIPTWPCSCNPLSVACPSLVYA